LPETLRKPAASLPSGGHKQKQSFWQGVHQILIKPWRSVLFLKYPPVLCAIIYASMVFGTLYCINVAIPYTFSAKPYNFSSVVQGLLYLGNSTGYILGSVLGGRWSDHILKKEAARNGGVEVPETRIGLNCWVGCSVLPLGVLLYGWTTDKGVFWFVPMIGTFIFGLSLMIVFATSTTYLVDALPGRSSTAVALNNLIRNAFAAIGGIVSEPLLKVMGSGWLFTALAILCYIFVIFLWAIHRYGRKWRSEFDIARYT